MGFLLDEARTSGLVTAGVSPAAGLAYLKLLRDGVNVIEMIKAKRSISNTVSVLCIRHYKNDEAILSKLFFPSTCKEKPNGADNSKNRYPNFELYAMRRSSM